MRDRELPHLLKSPWIVVCLIVSTISLSVAYAPLAIILAIVGLSAASILIRCFGWLYGTWYLTLLLIPLREPLSLEFHGSVSIYLPDLLVFILTSKILAEKRIRATWSESYSFRIMIAILFLSIVGLYSASRIFWGVANVYRIGTQVAIFFVAKALIRDVDESRRTVFALAISLVVPIIYGFYQASLPYGTPLPEWSRTYTAYDLSGNPFRRIFSTFNHTLNFSHYLTTGIILCTSLALTLQGRWKRASLLAIACAGVVCNLYTYSIGGILGMTAGALAFIVVRRSGKLLAVAFLLLAVIIVFAPPALVAKAERVLTGQATTGAARIVTYQQSLMILQDNPILGVGWGGIRGSLEGKYRLSRAKPVAFTAENYFLQRSIALGMVGLALYIALIWIFTCNLRRYGEAYSKTDPATPLRVAIISAGVAFFSQGQFIPATDTSINLVLWIFFAIAETLRQTRRLRENNTMKIGAIPEASHSPAPNNQEKQQ